VTNSFQPADVPAYSNRSLTMSPSNAPQSVCLSMHASHYMFHSGCLASICAN